MVGGRCVGAWVRGRFVYLRIRLPIVDATLTNHLCRVPGVSVGRWVMGGVRRPNVGYVVGGRTVSAGGVAVACWRWCWCWRVGVLACWRGGWLMGVIRNLHVPQTVAPMTIVVQDRHSCGVLQAGSLLSVPNLLL